MTDVALIGCDGAGKTTVAKMLLDTMPTTFRYVYMGVNAQSSNVALPTTRIVHALKVRKVREERKQRGEPVDSPVSLHGIEHRRDSRGKVWAAARLVNRIAEELLRQAISVWHQLRGRVVIYDRHFLFDYGAVKPTTRLSDRFHRWFLEKVYPKPDLVLFLDAPSQVLFDRKQEVPVSYLDSRRAAYLIQGEHVDRFELVDATQPLDNVYEEVLGRIERVIRESGGRVRGDGSGTVRRGDDDGGSR